MSNNNLTFSFFIVIKALFRFIFTFVFLFIYKHHFAQNVAQPIEKNLIWVRDSAKLDAPKLKNIDISYPTYNGISFPSIVETNISNGKDSFIFSLLNYLPIETNNAYLYSLITKLNAKSIVPQSFHSMNGNSNISGYKLPLYKYENGKLLQLQSYRYNIKTGSNNNSIVKTNTHKRALTPSVLSTGDWYKFSISEEGIYKIDASLLQQAGININNINPKTLKVYGNQTGILPEANSAPRPDDLQENAIFVSGEDDGVFNSNDYILFYAKGPHQWKYDANSSKITHELNIYSDKSYFFITYGGANGKRMDTLQNGNNLTPQQSFTTYDYCLYHEQETENFCKEGRIYLGEKFETTNTITFQHSIPNLDISNPIKVKFDGVHISPSSSNLSLNINGVLSGFQYYDAFPFGSGEPPCYVGSYTLGTATQTVSSDNIQLKFTYQKKTPDSKAWLNYYELTAKRQLVFNESFMPFRNLNSANNTVNEYQVNNLSANSIIYNITDPLNPKIQLFYNGNTFRSSNSVGNIEQYAISNGNTKTPYFEGKVNNQNLHSLSNIQYIIVSPSEFKSAAQNLANYHTNTNQINTVVVTPQEIYNEFSSGAQDISAIRDFFKYIYYNDVNPNTQLRYAMFLGDASFDYKNKITNNTNFVPIYQSPNFDFAYCSDDYFGFLDPADGDWGIEQKLEIAVTRLPVATLDEANGVINKILQYKNTLSLGEWRNSVTFTADDFDDPGGWETSFVNDFESIFAGLDTSYKNINVRKIYTDAYKQQNLGGSQRYPDAQQAIKEEFEKGTLIFNYIGHGGVKYLASEKILDVAAISELKNMYSLPVFFTATCEFSKFDDATYKSAGEYVITNPNGGAVAMFTTTRVVYASDNANLTKYFWSNCVFEKINNRWPTLGEVYKKLKNRPYSSSNDRKFTLFADPALTMNYPENNIVIDSLNFKDVAQQIDTIKALSTITFTGHLEDISGNKLTQFNGTLESTVYDKKNSFTTLGNDLGNHTASYKLYSNMLYKGKTSVNQGNFTFSFVAPKDIAYNYGIGKVSLYADNGTTDASGNFSQVIIGGANSNIAEDNTGPKISLFINDFSFKSGGLSGANPLLLATLYDEHGINASGNGIGHDIVITIDKGTNYEKRFIVNSFYTAKLNSFTTGDIQYQLNGLSVGKHTYTLKAWDVYNNPNEASIEFYVEDDNKIKLSNVKNYPNPFSTHTTFSFDHNKAGKNLHITLEILTIEGKTITLIEKDVPNADGHITEIQWNKSESYAGPLSRGIYLYRIRVKSDDGQETEKIEKLILL